MAHLCHRRETRGVTWILGGLAVLDVLLGWRGRLGALPSAACPFNDSRQGPREDTGQSR